MPGFIAVPESCKEGGRLEAPDELALLFAQRRPCIEIGAESSGWKSLEAAAFKQ
jgi:hypothetical protein